MFKLSVLNILLLFSTICFSEIPTNYYQSLEGKTGAGLKTAVHDIICQDTTHYFAYGSGSNHTWQGFYSIDRNAVTNLVVDMYSDSLRYFSTNYIEENYPSFGQTIHLEHCLPKSWWGSHEWAAYKDLNNLYPSDGNINLSKSNNPLGVVTGTPTTNNGVSKVGPAVYPGYIGNVFEPADVYKGDFARTYLYMVTTYENYVNYWDSPMLDNNTYPVFNAWAKELLLQWCRQDPVSDKEITRTNKVYELQHSRNPFIDLPELVEYIWGNKNTVAFSFSSASNSSIEITENDLTSNQNLIFETKKNNPVTKTLKIKGSSLVADISILKSGINTSVFNVSVTTITKANATEGYEINITYAPTKTGNHSALITINSTNASSFIINLSGINLE